MPTTPHIEQYVTATAHWHAMDHFLDRGNKVLDDFQNASPLPIALTSKPGRSSVSPSPSPRSNTLKASSALSPPQDPGRGNRGG
jgi:hypothetical protein